MSEQFDASKMPVVEGLDWNYGYSHFNDEEFLVETVRDYISVFPEEINAVRENYEKIASGDESAAENFRIHAHSLKSTSIYIGLIPIAGISAVMEYAARDGKLDMVRDMAPHYIKECEKYLEKLTTAFPEENSGEGKPIEDKDAYNDLLADLYDKISDFDVHGADAIMEKLDEYRLPEEISGHYTRLKSAVTNLDVDLVTEIVGIISEML